MASKPILRAGTTVMEMIVVTFMIALLVTVISVILWETYRTTDIQLARGGLQLTTRGALERISDQSRQAVGISNTQGGYTTSSQILIIKLPALDNNQAIIDSTYDYRVYRLNAGTLEEITIANAASSRDSDTRPILANATSLKLIYYDSSGATLTTDYSTTKQIRIGLSASETTDTLTNQTDFSTLVTLRNI